MTAALSPFPPVREVNWRVVPLDGVEVVTMAPVAHRFLVEGEHSGKPVGLVRADVADLAALAPEMARKLQKFVKFLDSGVAHLDRSGHHDEAQRLYEEASAVRALLERAGIEA